MTIALFVIVVSAWSASSDFSTVYFNIPFSWVRVCGSKIPSLQTLRSPSGPNLQGISIMNTRIGWETIYFKLRNKDLFIDMDCSACDLERGNIFEVSLFCHSCHDKSKGYVVSTPNNSQQRGFYVLEPTQIPGSTFFVNFSKIDAHKPNELCAYYAEEARFTVRRFLCECQDLSRYVVQAQVTYDNPHNVVIEWGVDADSAIQKTDNNQKVFKLCCSCAQNTVS